ncbi:hypothetical protein [Paenibacillus sp. OAE614]
MIHMHGIMPYHPSYPKPQPVNRPVKENADKNRSFQEILQEKISQNR